MPSRSWTVDAALILFGTSAALGRHLPQAELVLEYRSSEASGPAAERTEFREGLFLWRVAIWEKVNQRNDRQSYQDGLFRVELPTFDEVSVREAWIERRTRRFCCNISRTTRQPALEWRSSARCCRLSAVVRSRCGFVSCATQKKSTALG